MKEWAHDKWANIFPNPPINGSAGNILVAEVHRTQQTDSVKILFQSKKTILVNVPPGCAWLVQPLDVVINNSFKKAIKKQFQKHLDESEDDYFDGELTVSDRIVLKTSALIIRGKGLVKVKI